MAGLNFQSPIPLYFQLADFILAKVRSGEFPPGSRIPSEHQLAAAYKIGRPTARQATERLVRKGVLVRRRGAGTFVDKPQREVDLFSFAGTISSFRQKGISIRTHILRKAVLKKIKTSPENPFYGRKAYFLSRLSRAEGQPVLIEDIYLNTASFPGIERIDLTDQSLSRIVDERYYMKPTGGRQNFHIGYVTGHRARQLKVSSDIPILVVKRFIHFGQAENAVYSELFCRTDQFVFSQEIGGPGYG
jgi:GntR family transcriptional regulator